MNRYIVAGTVVNILSQAGVNRDALEHIWDRLLDGLAQDTEQELIILYSLLKPEDSSIIFVRDGKVSSPKEPGAVAYRKV